MSFKKIFKNIDPVWNHFANLSSEPADNSVTLKHERCERVQSCCDSKGSWLTSAGHYYQAARAASAHYQPSGPVKFGPTLSGSLQDSLSLTHTHAHKETHTHTHCICPPPPAHILPQCVSSLNCWLPWWGKRGLDGREERRQWGCDTTMAGSDFRSI